jgi:hypothetical protein
MPTVLRVSGIFELLRQSMPLAPFEFTEPVAARTAREREASADNGRSTYNVTVSDAGGDRVPEQIRESAEFLARNSDALRRLRELPGVEKLCLDFSWDFPRTSTGQWNCFPSSFLMACASLEIGLEVSVYAVSERMVQ